MTYEADEFKQIFDKNLTGSKFTQILFHDLSRSIVFGAVSFCFVFVMFKGQSGTANRRYQL